MVLGRLKIQGKHSKPRVSGRRSQCPNICDMVLSSTTPSKIKPMLTIPMKSGFCPKNVTLTKAVKTGPTPAQMAHAVAIGMVFSAINKVQNTTKLTTTPTKRKS